MNNFDVETEIIEKNISIKLDNHVITQRDLEIIVINEPWKKIVSLVILAIDLFVLLLFFTEFKVIENFKTNSLNRFKQAVNWIRKI